MDFLNDALIGHFVSGVISFVASSVHNLFRKLTKAKITKANNAMIAYFQRNITSDYGVLDKGEYLKIRYQLCKKYGVSSLDLFTIEQLRNELISKVNPTAFLTDAQKISVISRILDFTSDRQGSESIETILTLCLAILSVLGAFELINQITTHTFVLSAGKVVGFLISVISFLIIAKKRHH